MPDGFISLMYHNVVSDDAAAARARYSGLSPSITSYFVTAEQFEQHLDALTCIATVITAADVARYYESPHVTTGSRVQLTFDDGWRDSVDVAGPLLADRGLQATLFVTTGLLDRPHFLTRSELARLPHNTFQVGSHTVTHPFLNELDEASIRNELQHSRSDLQDLLGRDIDSLSIPNGAADPRVVRIASECGYRFVYLSTPHRNTRRRGPLSIGRAAIRGSTGAKTIARHASGNLRHEQARTALLSLPKRLLGTVRYRRLRGMLLGERPETQEMHHLVGAFDGLAADNGRAPTLARSLAGQQ